MIVKAVPHSLVVFVALRWSPLRVVAVEPFKNLWGGGKSYFSLLHRNNNSSTNNENASSEMISNTATSDFVSTFPTEYFTANVKPKEKMLQFSGINNPPSEPVDICDADRIHMIKRDGRRDILDQNQVRNMQQLFIRGG